MKVRWREPPPAEFRSGRNTSAPFTAPYTVAVDSREKAPYTFMGLETDAKIGRRPLVVDRSWQHLPTGDYSLVGCEDLVAVERKSAEDLYATLGQHRDRFEAEHARLQKIGNSIVVIEAGWEELLTNPPKRSRLHPKTVHRTALAWYLRYGVPWFACGSRRLAEITTLRFLERFWYELQDALSRSDDNCRKCGRPLRDHVSRERGMGPVCAGRGDRILAMKIRRGGFDL